MAKTIIKVENLGKKYVIGERQTYYSLRDTVANLFSGNKKKVDEFWALKDVNFEVKQGESVGIIGRNGAGKSTLLKILSRITPPTTGKITLEGRVASLLEVGTGFNPELTGRENIYLNGAILGMKRAEIKRKFDEIVDFSEVEKFLDMPVKHYSSGMYMRLAFAVAAHLESEILIVDEVLAVGDAQFQKKCLGKMGEVTSKEARTVLFVSHNMGAIKELCSKTIYLKDGKIRSFGNTGKIIGQFTNDCLNTKSVRDKIYIERKGNGRVQVKDIRITNQFGDINIHSFDKLRIFLRLSVIDNVEKIELKIPVIDANSEVLFRVDTDSISVSRRKIIEINIETEILNFTPTRCFINIGVFADGELADYLLDVYSFEILKKSVEGVKFYDRNWCVALVGHKVIHNI